MAVSKMRLLKREWSSFIKNFNRQNQFRRTTLTVGEKVLVGEPGLPLVGLSYNPDERKVDVYLGGTDPKSPAHLVHGIQVPRALYSVRDDEAANPVMGMQIQGAPGTGMAHVIFRDDGQEDSKYQWIANVAYSIYEVRGSEEHGEDQMDWYEAEKIIAEVTTPFLV